MRCVFPSTTSDNEVIGAFGVMLSSDGKTSKTNKSERGEKYGVSRIWGSDVVPTNDSQF